MGFWGEEDCRRENQEEEGHLEANWEEDLENHHEVAGYSSHLLARVSERNGCAYTGIEPCLSPVSSITPAT
jgi:hypothetical protein